MPYVQRKNTRHNATTCQSSAEAELSPKFMCGDLNPYQSGEISCATHTKPTEEIVHNYGKREFQKFSTNGQHLAFMKGIYVSATL